MFSIIHMNDLHSHLENWVPIKMFIQKAKQQALERKENLYIVDSGDAIDNSHPFVEATHGRIIVDLFNEIGVDFVTIGNNEGLNFSPDQLTNIYSQKKFDVIISNLRLCNGKLPKWAELFKIIKVNNKTIAILGVTAPYPTYMLNGYKIISPIEAIQNALHIVQKKHGQMDQVILISHVGIEMDRYIAKQIPKINIILGGHTHHLFINGKWEQLTYFSANEKFGHYITKIDFTYRDDLDIWNINGTTYSINQLSEDLKETNLINYKEEGRKLLTKIKVGIIPDDLSIIEDNNQIPTFIQLTMDAFKELTKADFALLNSGLFLKSISRGIVSKDDLHQALPHSMRAMTFDLTGQELIELIQTVSQIQASWIHRPISGFGFRGKIFGKLYFSDFPVENYHKQHKFNQHLIRQEKTYRLVTTDHIYYLKIFPLLHQVKNKKIFFPKILREIIEQYIKKYYPYDIRGRVDGTE